MSITCYICTNEAEGINFVFPDGDTLDDVYSNDYTIKKGIFSKEKVRICESCLKNLKKLFKDSLTGDRMSLDSRLVPKTLDFIENNKDKIIQGDLSKVPKCPNCKSQTSQLDIVKCDECNKKFCDDCMPFDMGDVWDQTKGGKAFDYICENYMNSDEMICPLCYDKKVNKKIINLLKKKAVKIAVSDIAAFLKFDRDFTKWQLERMYKNKEIDFAGNGRYFILADEKKKSKKAAAKKTGSVADEIKKFKELLDAGAITQKEYDAKKKELLGL